MMDRDRRAEAAAALREYADTLHPEPEEGSEADQDAALNLRAMADELTTESEGYDYEAAAAERGETIEALIAARDLMVDKYGASGSSAAREALANRFADAKIIMEGVQRPYRLVPVGTLRNLREFLYFLRGLAGPLTDATNKRGDDLRDALAAAEHDERVSWPS